MSKTIEFGIKLRMDGREVDATLVGTREQFRQVGAAGQAAGQQVAAGMNAGTISAKQMQAALRGVPAQFTDIATALASGQNPMTVFLQQGGQLKDMFGGAGAAARALGGYVAGLVNPFTVAAAAIGGVGYAAYVANREVDGFRVALAAGGAALGVTVDELRAMTTQTNVSADALTAFVASGAVTRGSLAAITAEAVRFEDATGTAVDETVKRFQELGRAPVAAALKLNEQTHFLTAALYKQAAAMEAAGDKAGAARLLQEAYRAELQRIADTVEAALGPVASAWLGVERAIDGAWKATKRFLGGGDLAAQIADQQAKVAELQAVVDKGGDAFLRGKLGAAKQLLFVMQSQASLDAGTAQARREAYEATQKQIAHEQALADLMQRQSGVSKTFARDLRTLDAERESGRMSVEAYREAVKKLIATETDLGRASQRKHGESDFEKLRQALTAKTAAQEADAASAEKLNDTQRDYAKWLRMVTEGLLKLTPAEMRQAAALWDAALAAAAAADATAADRKANEEYVKAVEASEAAIHKEMDALRERAPVAQDELATYGKTKAAIEDLAIARLEEQLVMVDGWDSQEALANRLREEIALRKEYRNAVAGKESADMAARAAQDATRYWDRAAIDVGRSLADEIMRGGKSGGELLEDYFRTLVLQPSIQGVANVGMSAIGFGAPAGSGAAGTINAASNLSSLWGAFSGGTSYAAGSFAMSSVGQAMGLSSTSAAVPGMFVGDTAGAAGASLTGAGRTLSAAAPWIAAGLLAYNLFAGKSTPHRGGFATYSDAAGLTTGAATRGANRQLGGTGMRLDQFDASANSAAGNLAQGIATLFDNLGKSFGGATGYSVGTGFADDSSSDGAWGALRITDASGHDLTNWARGQRGGGPAFADGATGQAQYQRAVADSVLATLRDIDLPAWADNMLDALGSAPSLDKIVETADLITALKPVAGQLTDLGVAAENITPAAIAAAGGIDNLTATLAALPNINADANAAFEESRRASLSAASAYLESTERARQAASDWDGSLTSAQALGAAVQQRYQDELAYLQQVRDMVRTITADVAGAQNQYLLDTLDPAGKYDYYDRQMAAAMDMIRTSADPEVISDYAQRYLRAQGAAWQLLTPEQQRQYLPEFTADAADVGTLVTSRGGAIESSVRADNEAFATTLKDAVVEAIKEAFKPATDAITDAANTPTTSNVNVNVHIAADPTLAAMYGGGYAEVLPGIAYSVIQVAPGEGAGWLQCAAIWRGLRLYDPRTDSVVWSPNRALWLADFVVNTIYGAARGIDKDSVIDAAEACDDPVGGQPRRSGGGLVLDTRQEIAAWLETLRTYAGCAVVDEGGLVKLIPNRPRAPVFAFRHSDGNIISMAPVRSARLADVPTVVEVQWTDTSQLPWRQRSAFAPANGLPAAGKPFRLQTVPLLGIHSESQATREAVERLNQQTLCELATEIEVFAEGARIEPGDRGNVDWPAHGFADKEFLVTATRRDGWRYKLSLLETDPAMYSDAIVAESSTPDTTLPNPSTPPAVASVTLVESLVQYDDGRIESVIDATWPAVEWPYPIEYLVELIDGAKTLPITRTRNLRARTPALVEGRTYTVRVAVVGSGIYAGAYASASLAVQGKLLLPANIASLTGFEIGGEVRLTIGPSFDKDLKGLEVRYGPLGVAWADAKFVDFVPAASGVGGRVVYGDAPEGTWEFLACGRDSIGQYSPVPARLTLDVTLDLRAFLVGNHDYTNPTPTGMREYHLPGDPTRYWVTDDFVPAATRFPAATADVYTDIAATYHAPQTSELLSEAWDVGIDAAGSWAGEIASEAISGAKTDYIALSPTGAGGSYVEQSGLTAKANARFGKVGARATGAATLKVALPALKLRVDAIPRSESFNVTTVASGPTVLNLSHGCAKFKGLSFEPIGPSACAARWNNPIVGDTPSIELYTLDLAGNQAAYTGIAKVETV